jgi:prepilin-type N-terminal cleavage/methylation domain-containing protein
LKQRFAKRGFTLVELLVVIAIIAVLIGLTVPAVMRVRGAANRTTCSNNLRQIGLALHNYHVSHGSFPPGVGYESGAAPFPFMSWNARLLPFLEQDNLWKQTLEAFAQDHNFLAQPPHVGLGTVVPVFACPADSRTLVSRDIGSKTVAFTGYLGVEGTNQFKKDGVLYLDSRVRFADITDGSSNTLAVGERPPSADGVLGWWYAGEGQAKDGSADMVLGVQELNGFTWASPCPPGPFAFGPGRIENQCDALHFWSLHFGGGGNFLFADNSLRFISYSAVRIMPAIATRNGGEPVTNTE